MFCATKSNCDLQAALARGDIWQGGQTAAATLYSGIATGIEALDRVLPGRGWPRRALTEILGSPDSGVALRLLLPALARLSQNQWLVWIAPPHIPYAPGLSARGINLSRLIWVTRQQGRNEALWAFEQALRCVGCGAALVWLDGELKPTVLRRLQLAAESGNSCGFIFRSHESEHQPSTAALRIKLKYTQDVIDICLLKRKGGWPTVVRYLEGGQSHLPRGGTP